MFLERLYRQRRCLKEVAATSGHLFADGTFLTEMEYLLVRDVVGVLRPLVQATNLLQSDGFMGSSYLPIMHTLKHELSVEVPVQVAAGGENPKQTMPVTESGLCEPARLFRAAVRHELGLVERHVEPCREIMSLAAAVDPRYKHLPWLGTYEEKETVRVQFLEEALSLAEACQRGLASSPSAVSKASGIPVGGPRKRLRRVTSDDLGSLQGFSDSLNRLCGEPVRPDRSATPLRRDFQAAVRAYFASPGIRLGEDALHWWQEIGSKAFPLLVPLARKYLSVGGSSGRIERTWSAGRLLLPFMRSSLDGNLAGDILKLRSNMVPLEMMRGFADSKEEENVLDAPEPLMT